jgi:hypothetical protein
MTRRLWLILVVVALLVLAVAGWAVDGVRWAAAGLRPGLRPA